MLSPRLRSTATPMSLVGTQSSERLWRKCQWPDRYRCGIDVSSCQNVARLEARETLTRAAQDLVSERGAVMAA